MSIIRLLSFHSNPIIRLFNSIKLLYVREEYPLLINSYREELRAYTHIYMDDELLCKNFMESFVLLLLDNVYSAIIENRYWDIFNAFSQDAIAHQFYIKPQYLSKILGEFNVEEEPIIRKITQNYMIHLYYEILHIDPEIKKVFFELLDDLNSQMPYVKPISFYFICSERMPILVGAFLT